jgi:hypothetical protein
MRVSGNLLCLTPLILSQYFCLKLMTAIFHMKEVKTRFVSVHKKKIIFLNGESAEILRVESLVRDGNCKILQMWLQRSLNSIK